MRHGTYVFGLGRKAKQLTHLYLIFKLKSVNVNTELMRFGSMMGRERRQSP